MASENTQKNRIADTWRVNPISTLTGAERHSRFVFVMRLTLPILAVGLIAIVLIYSVAYKPNIQRVLEYPVIGLGTGAVSMTKPRLTGMDALDRYFVVTARNADRMPDDPDTVTLSQVAADITKQGEMVLSLRASRGQIYSATNVLEFGPLVEIDLPDGYSFVTDRTEVEMRTGVIKGDTPLRGSGPMGEITANSFKVNQEEDIFELRGNVHIKVDMSHMKSLGQTPSPATNESEEPE